MRKTRSVLVATAVIAAIGLCPAAVSTAPTSAAAVPETLFRNVRVF